MSEPLFTLTPSDKLDVVSEAGQFLTSYLSFRNISDRSLLFKVIPRQIKSTAPERFLVRPNCGLLIIGEEIQIRVDTKKPVIPKLCVEVGFAEGAKGTNLTETFKSLDIKAKAVVLVAVHEPSYLASMGSKEAPKDLETNPSSTIAASPETVNQLCGYCNIRTPNVYCTCQNRITFMCIEDLSQHYEKNRGLTHHILPIESFPSERKRLRSEAFTRGKDELLKNLPIIDNCMRDTSAAIDDLVISLQQFKEQVLGQLRAEKDRLEKVIWETITEVETGLDQEVPTLKNWLAATLRQHKPGTLNLFQYKLNIDYLARTIGDIVKCTQIDYLSGRKVPLVFAYPQQGDVGKRLEKETSVLEEEKEGINEDYQDR